MNRTVLAVGVIITTVLVGLLFLGLGKNPNEIRSPLIGRTAPAFALREAGTGRTVDIAQFRGKPVVINFWATWCGPCWEEHPVLVAGARVHPDVQFLGVVDDRGKTAIAYGVAGVPETFFLDEKGVIVAKYSGPLNSSDLEQELRKVVR